MCEKTENFQIFCHPINCSFSLKNKIKDAVNVVTKNMLKRL